MQLWRQQLLLFLCSLDTKAEIQQTEYFNHHQVECAKQVATLMTADMTGHQTIEQLAQTVGLVFLARPISSLMQAPGEALDLTTSYVRICGAGIFFIMAYIMSIQPNASLTMIGLAAPTSTAVGVLLNICFFLYLNRKEKKQG